VSSTCGPNRGDDLQNSATRDVRRGAGTGHLTQRPTSPVLLGGRNVNRCPDLELRPAGDDEQRTTVREVLSRRAVCGSTTWPEIWRRSLPSAAEITGSRGGHGRVAVICSATSCDGRARHRVRRCLGRRPRGVRFERLMPRPLRVLWSQRDTWSAQMADPRSAPSPFARALARCARGLRWWLSTTMARSTRGESIS